MNATDRIRPSRPTPAPLLAEEERRGLPWWSYFNRELLEIEQEELFRKHWQLVGHVNDVPQAGDFMTLDIVGERALTLRGQDGQVRSFHNVCRHRGSRVVAKASGNCRGNIVCPFHGWTYALDGTLRAMPRPRSLPQLDPQVHGLVPLEQEIWLGFVFVRFLESTQPSVAQLMAPYEEEIARYRLGELQPRSGFYSEEIPVNWKAVRDVDNEGYHVPIAHPSLQDLYGRGYADDRHHRGLSRSFAGFNDGIGRHWSVRHYKKILPEVAHLPESHRRAWLYVGLFPNMVFSFFPDRIGFYQEWPVAVDRTVQRGASYALADERREMKLARYLSERIDRVTTREDTQLIVWSWEAMQSSGFSGTILSDLEAGVRDYHDELRRRIPVLNLEEEPTAGTLAGLNGSLLASNKAQKQRRARRASREREQAAATAPAAAPTIASAPASVPTAAPTQPTTAPALPAALPEAVA
jgi:carnitine monooxygenase subunit